MDKLSLKFLLPAKFVNYDLLKPPGPNNIGGGVGVKYARIEEAGGEEYRCTRIAETGAVEADDIVFADWLWFCATDGKSMSDQAKAFIELQNPKCIYGSELCVLTWPQKLIQRLIENADLITYNTEYQRELYRVIGIHNSRFLCDPVPESLFFPSLHKMQRRLVCVGQISEAKRSIAVLKIFEKLRDSGVERFYIGGSMAWGNKYSYKKDAQLHNQIKAVSDSFIENATQGEMAEIINESAFYVHVSYHDVASSSNQENMSAGNITFGLTHPVLRERTPYRFDKPASLAQAVADYPFQTKKHQQDITKVVETANQWSYTAWREQISAILRLIT